MPVNNNNGNNNGNDFNKIHDDLTVALNAFIDKLKEDHNTFKTIRDFYRTLHNKIRIEKLGNPAFVGVDNGGPEIVRDLAPYQADHIVPILALIDTLEEPRGQFTEDIKLTFEDIEDDLEGEYQNGGKRKTRRRKERKSMKHRKMTRKTRTSRRKYRSSYRRRR
jgi:hypothetical protein